MGLLATWDKYSTYLSEQLVPIFDDNGEPTGEEEMVTFYRVIWEWPDGSIEFHKFVGMRTEPELEVEFEDIKRERDYGWISKLQTTLDDNEDLIKEVVIQIRTHPALTLNQYNQYLNGKEWYEQVVIRAFIYKIAILLAAKYDVQLDDYTEVEVLKKVRNWICNSEIRLLKRVIFGYNINI